MLHQNIQIIFILFCLFRQNNQNQAQNFTFFFLFWQNKQDWTEPFCSQRKKTSKPGQRSLGGCFTWFIVVCDCFLRFLFTLSPQHYSALAVFPFVFPFPRLSSNCSVSLRFGYDCPLFDYDDNKKDKESRDRRREREKKRERERKERELVRSVVANSSRQVVTETDVHVGEENEPCNQWQLQLLLFTRRRRGQGVTLGYGKSWGCGLLEVVRKRQKRDRV